MTVNAWELFATHHVYLHRLYNRRKPGAIGFCADPAVDGLLPNTEFGCRIYEVGWNELCTPGMGVNLWGVSPLCENQGCPYVGCYQKYEPKARACPGRDPGAYP
jgi:hypothetical protein